MIKFSKHPFSFHDESC